MEQKNGNEKTKNKKKRGTREKQKARESARERAKEREGEREGEERDRIEMSARLRGDEDPKSKNLEETRQKINQFLVTLSFTFINSISRSKKKQKTKHKTKRTVCDCSRAPDDKNTQPMRATEETGATRPERVTLALTERTQMNIKQLKKGGGAGGHSPPHNN